MALVWLMIPGVGFFYSGLLRRKNALSMLFLSLVGISVGTIQWVVWGYSWVIWIATHNDPLTTSLAFSSTASAFIGDLQHGGLKNVLAEPSIGSTRIPALLFCAYQGMFALITVVLAIGGFAERSRIGPIMVFVFVWLTLVYCPIACWTWNANGWSFIFGGLDFAGGTPVHINSGTAALAIAIYLGKRRGYGTERLAYKPHNTSFVILGTVFLWFGWFGFNGGSALSANLRAVQACIVTNVAASMGAVTWMLLDWRLERKFSAVGLCSGAIAGLVGITPAAGYVGTRKSRLAVLYQTPHWQTAAALAIGFVAGVGCNFATKLKFLFNVDETLDVFATHGIGGMIGGLMTALFAQASVAGFDGITVITGGWIDQNYRWVKLFARSRNGNSLVRQLGIQLADIVAGFAYSLVMTTIILWIMHFIPGLRLRASEEAEIVGIDDAYLGEFAYDYVGTDPELRLHRIESKPTMTNGDVLSHSTPEGSNVGMEHEKVPKHAMGNAAAGGGRVDV
jgi:Amt family ammonium transporter